MADTIQVEYDVLNQLAAEIRSQAESMEGLYRKISAQAEVLEASWVGEGAKAFQTEMQEVLLPAYRRLYQGLEAAGETTVRIGDHMREAEEEAAGLIPKGAESAWSGFLEWVHGGLDVVGLWPGAVVGEVADGVNAAIYLMEGRFKEAGISAISILPFGDIAKGGKWGVRAGKEIAEAAAEREAKQIAGEGLERGGARAGKVRVPTDADMARAIYQGRRVPLGQVPPSKMPPPGLTPEKFGYAMQDRIEPMVHSKWPDVKFEPQTTRGVEGPDIRVSKDGPDPGFDWIEIKPDSESGMTTFMREFGKSDAWEGRGRLVVYDQQGNVRYIDYEVQTE